MSSCSANTGKLVSMTCNQQPINPTKELVISEMETLMLEDQIKKWGYGFVFRDGIPMKIDLNKSKLNVK